MPSFGTKSKERLETCHPDIQMVMEEAIKTVDFSVVYGHRGKVEQNKAYESGHSTKKWPLSNHNFEPSMAIDILPYPSGWPQKTDALDQRIAKWGHFYYMAGVVMQCAKDLGIRLRWGNDWDGDGDFMDTKFRDAAHFELIAE